MNWAGFDELAAPLLLSLKIAAAAVAVVALFAIPLAVFMSRKRFKGKSFLESLIIVPMVMPPTVVGYAIIVLFGANGWIGRWPFRWTGYTIMFRFEGAVLAAAIVALPLLYLPAKAAFAAVERDLEETARLFGAGPLRVFWNVTLPLARRGIYSGLLLAFARALGEFGATIMVFGWQNDRLTLPISIYADVAQPGGLSHAIAAFLALGVLSLALTMAYNRSSAGVQE